MKRYLGWSAVFHSCILAVGALIAPLGGIFGTVYQPTEIISVGLVDFPIPPAGKPIEMPHPAVPTPAGNDLVALAPENNLTPEEITEAIELEPEKEPEKEPEEKQADQDNDNTDEGSKDGKPEDSVIVAQADTASHTGSISDGGGDAIWGVETAPNVNPYHRRGFAAIRSKWRNPVVGPTPRKCTVKFRVHRNGEITDIDLEKSSGVKIFDDAALRAVQYTEQWEQFPGFWEEDEQIIHLQFEYRP